MPGLGLGSSWHRGASECAAAVWRRLQDEHKRPVRVARRDVAQEVRVMKWHRDGDQIVVTKDDFVDLQQSPAVFVPVDSDNGRAIIRGGVLALPFGDLARIRAELEAQQ